MLAHLGEVRGDGESRGSQILSGLVGHKDFRLSSAYGQLLQSFEERSDMIWLLC